MPTTTLKPKTTKGGSATKPSLTNASAEKSRKMLEQMLAKKLSSSTKVPKTMTIKTGATKKSTATRSASAGATKGRKGGRRGGSTVPDPPSTEAADPLTQAPEAPAAEAPAAEAPGNTDRQTAAAETGAKGNTDRQTAAEGEQGASEKFAKIRKSMTFQCDMIEPEPHKGGGYRKNGTYVKKSSCAMSSKRPMSAKPTKKSSCGTVSAKKKQCLLDPKLLKSKCRMIIY